MSFDNRVKLASAWQKSRNEMDRKLRQNEVATSNRELRQGFRGFGMFQLVKYYAAEGVHVIDHGGPPVAGK